MITQSILGLPGPLIKKKEEEQGQECVQRGEAEVCSPDS